MKKIIASISMLCIALIGYTQCDFRYTNPTGTYRVEPGVIGPSNTIYVYDRAESLTLTNETSAFSNTLSYPSTFVDCYVWTETKLYNGASTLTPVCLNEYPDQTTRYGSVWGHGWGGGIYYNPTHTIEPHTLPTDVLAVRYYRIGWNGEPVYEANDRAYGATSNDVEVVLMFNMSAGEIGPSLQVLTEAQNPVTLYNVAAGSCVDNYPIAYQWEHSTDGNTWQPITATPTTFPSNDNIEYLPGNDKGLNYYRRATYNNEYSVPVYSNEVTVHNVYVTSAGTIKENPTSCDIRYINFTEDTPITYSGDGTVPCNYKHGYEISYNNGSTWEVVNLQAGQPFNVSIPFGEEFQIRRFIEDAFDEIEGVKQYTNIITKEASAPGVIVDASTSLCQSNNNPIRINNVTAGSYNGQPVSYQWSVSSNNSVYTDIAGETSESLVYNPATYNENLFFQRRMYLTGCAEYYSLSSNTVEVHVAGALDGGIISSDKSTYCYEEAISTLVVNDNNGTRTPAYIWYLKPHDNSQDWDRVYYHVAGVNDRQHDLDLTTLRRTLWDWSLNHGGVDFRRTVWDIPNDCRSYSNTYTITTYPEINAGVIGYDEVICSSFEINEVPDVEQVTLPTGGDGEGYTFAWEIQNEGETVWNTIPGVASARLDITEIPTETKKYRRIVHDGCLADNQFRYSNEVTHTFKDYSIEGTIDSVIECDGTTVTFNAPFSYEQYEWNLNNNLYTSGGQVYTKNLELTDNSMALRVTDSDGCQAETAVSIKVNENPTFTLQDVHICSDDSVEVIAPDNYASYMFDGSSSVTNTTIITHNDAVLNSSRRISVIDTNGCESGDITYTAFPENLPPVSLNDDYICFGESYNLSIQAYPTIRNVTWRDNTGIIASGPGIYNLNVNPQETTTYYVEVENEYCSAVDSMTLTVHENPVISLRDTTACFMSNLTLTAEDNYPLHYWSTNNFFEGATTTFEVRNNLTATLRVVDNNGCEATASMQVSVQALPTFTVNNVDGCVGDTVTLSAPAGWSGYLWENGETTREIQRIVMPFGHVENDINITVFDSLGCNTTNTASINTLPSPLSPGIVTQNVCEGVEHMIQSPRTYHSYLWSTGATTHSISERFFDNTTIRLRVGNEYGCYDTSSFDVIVNNVPEFTINDTSICSGNQLAIQSPISGSGLSYYWSNGSIGQYALFDISTNSDFFLEVTEGICSYRDTFNVVVNSLPQVFLPDTGICFGDSLIYTYQELFSNYEWSNGQVGQTLRTQVNTSDNISLTVTDANGCEGTGIMEITRHFPPNVYITGDNSICEGSEVELSVSSSFPEILWSTGETSPIIRHIITENSSYGVTVSDINGCSASDEINIEVNTVPVGQLPDTTTVCNGDYIVLSHAGNYSLSWSTGATGNNVLFVPTNSVMVYLTLTDNNGCVGYDSMYVNVIDIPVIEIPIAEVCEGDSVLLESPQVFENMLWSTGDTTSYTYIKPINLVTNVTFTYSDNNGCGSTENTRVDLLTVTPFSINPKSICAGESATLSAQLGFIEYLWTTGESTPNILVNPTETTTYGVTVTDNKGCKLTKETFVEVNQLPEIQIDDQSICPDMNVTLNGPLGSYNYRWSNGINTRYITIPYNAAGEYSLTVTDRYTSCQYTEEFMVTAVPEPYYTFSDTSICNGQSITYDLPLDYQFIWWNETTNIKTISPNRDTEYIVGIVDTFNCTTTNTFNVEVYNAPILNIEDMVLCEKSQVILDVPYNADFYYTWSNGKSGNVETSVLYNVEGTIWGWVRAENINCSVSDTFKIVSEYMPDFNQKDLLLCENDSILVTLPEEYIYDWSTGATSNINYITNDDKGLILVNVSSINGCHTSFEFNADVEILTLQITNDGNSEIYVDTDLNIEANAGGSTGYFYNWLIGEYTYTGKNIVFSTNVVGTYDLNLDMESINGCKLNMFLEEFVTVIEKDTNNNDTTGHTSVNDVQSHLGVKIYPNPANEFVYIDANEYGAENEINISIYDLTGKELIYKELSPSTINRVDIDGLKEGVYVVRLTINGFVKQTKLLKEY